MNTLSRRGFIKVVAGGLGGLESEAFVALAPQDQEPHKSSRWIKLPRSEGENSWKVIWGDGQGVQEAIVNSKTDGSAVLTMGVNKVIIVNEERVFGLCEWPGFGNARRTSVNLNGARIIFPSIYVEDSGIRTLITSQNPGLAEIVMAVQKEMGDGVKTLIKVVKDTSGNIVSVDHAGNIEQDGRQLAIFKRENVPGSPEYFMGFIERVLGEARQWEVQPANQTD